MMQSDHLTPDRIRQLFMPSFTWLSLGTSIPVRMWCLDVDVVFPKLFRGDGASQEPLSLSLADQI